MALQWGSKPTAEWKKADGVTGAWRRQIKRPSVSSLPKTPINSKNVFKTLDHVRHAWAGVRDLAYKLMAIAWQIVLLLRKKKELMKEFVRLAKLKAKKGKIADAIMIYVMRAKTSSTRKMAWKRSRVLQFLHEQGVKSSKMAHEIDARGGIEAIYKQAVNQMPRRKSKSAKEKAGQREARGSAEKVKTNIEQTPPPSSDHEFDKPSPHTNDQRTMLLLSIKMSDREELSEMSEATITIKRNNNQNGAKFNVLRIKGLPAKSQPEDR